jgi:dihydroorotase
MARNQDTLTLRKEPWTAPQEYPFGNAKLAPLRAGETLQWRLIE